MCDRIGIIKNGELISTQNLHDSPDEKQVIQVQMEVKPAEKAKELLKAEHNVDATIKDRVLLFPSEKEDVPKLIQTLAKQDIAIYQVSAAKASLEDKFFDLIGENTIE
jgi:ABC-2 type transport system ATP-binding protein